MTTRTSRLTNAVKRITTDIARLRPDLYFFIGYLSLLTIALFVLMGMYHNDIAEANAAEIMQAAEVLFFIIITLPVWFAILAAIGRYVLRKAGYSFEGRYVTRDEYEELRSQHESLESQYRHLRQMIRDRDLHVHLLDESGIPDGGEDE